MNLCVEIGIGSVPGRIWVLEELHYGGVSDQNGQFQSVLQEVQEPNRLLVVFDMKRLDPRFHAISKVSEEGPRNADFDLWL